MPREGRDSGGPRQVIGGHVHCSGADDWYCCAIDGVAGTDGVSVEVEDGRGITRRPIESPLGAFVACANGRSPAVFRVRDAQAAVLSERSFVIDSA
jgi:hypothetical protein